MCRVLEFCERTFYAAKARPRSARAITDDARKTVISVEWKANYSCYGARRLHKHLQRQGHQVARCTVARLMRELDIHGVQRGRKQFTTHADKTADRPPDPVKRDFTATAPNQLWLADITYCSTWDGWLYVAFILDVYARMILGWQIATHMRTDLVLDALEMAAWRRQLIERCVHHSDAGSSVHLDPLHRQARHRRPIGIGRDRRRLVRQRDGRSTERHVQGRARHPPRTMANPTRPRDRDHRVDRLVQPPPPPLRDRRHPTRRT